ncbi:MAG: hypothetical protein IJL70_04670, partial [Treponema sp.]|nr:hypothetical protein [Treponema sp.]
LNFDFNIIAIKKYLPVDKRLSKPRERRLQPKKCSGGAFLAILRAAVLRWPLSGLHADLGFITNPKNG